MVGTPLSHDCLIDQLRTLRRTVERTRRRDATGSASNANARLFRALSRLMPEVIPPDPSRAEYRQGNTLGPRHHRWRRARTAMRFRLFLRFEARAKVVVHTWVHDQATRRSTGSRADPYTVFAKMPARGNPPGDGSSLMTASWQDWQTGKQP